MIKPVGVHTVSSRADNHTIDSKTGGYKDPLMNWPLRGAAFTNEVGEALRPIYRECCKYDLGSGFDVYRC